MNPDFYQMQAATRKREYAQMTKRSRQAELHKAAMERRRKAKQGGKR